jgi:predicted RNase H-like HicB family nuclease
VTGIERTSTGVVQAFLRQVRRAFHSFETSRSERPGQVEATWAFTVEVTEDHLDGGWVAECLNFPGCVSQGETQEEAVNNLTEALTEILRLRIERGMQEVRSSTSNGSTKGNIAITV